MKAQLRHMYRNDKFALSMIDLYINHFRGYDEDEQYRLLWDEDALRVDFEIWIAQYDDMELEASLW